MSLALIEFKEAALGYQKGRPVLTGVDFVVDSGAFWGILGANGSGKTTVLKTLLGLIDPLQGKVLARGREDARARFGYVPQKERLDPIYPLSAFDVAAMGTYRSFEPLARFRRKNKRAFIENCLDDCGAAALAGQPYSALSGGQKQRVLIARALAAAPEILVLDEPLSGIDASTQKALLELLNRIKHEHDLTVLMVSHRIREEKSLFSHIAWVEDGRVLVGKAAEMLAQGRLAEVFWSEL